MFETFPKGKKPATKGCDARHKKSEELSSPLRARSTITDSEEKRAEQVYGNYYGKNPRKPRPEFKGTMTSPMKTIISIG